MRSSTSFPLIHPSQAAVTKAGGKWAEAGSVSFNFAKKGVIVIASDVDEEALYEVEGVEDVIPVEKEVTPTHESHNPNP